MVSLKKQKRRRKRRRENNEIDKIHKSTLKFIPLLFKSFKKKTCISCDCNIKRVKKNAWKEIEINKQQQI